MRTKTPLTTRDVIDVMSEEYRTLREESLQGITARHQIITVALGALSVIIAGLVAEKAHSLVVFLTAYVLVPWLCKAFLLMWLGEYGRSVRAGGALRHLEKRINAVASREVLSWETRLTASKSHMSFPYSTVVQVFTYTSYLSALIGIFFACEFAATHPVFHLDLDGALNLRHVFDPVAALGITAAVLLGIAGVLEYLFTKRVNKLWAGIVRGMTH